MVDSSDTLFDVLSRLHDGVYVPMASEAPNLSDVINASFIVRKYIKGASDTITDKEQEWFAQNKDKKTFHLFNAFYRHKRLK